VAVSTGGGKGKWRTRTDEFGKRGEKFVTGLMGRGSGSPTVTARVKLLQNR